MSAGIAQLSPQQMATIQRIAVEVRSRQTGDSSGHDWTHTVRVWNLALVIAAAEHADIFIVSLSALLHDVGDWKLFDGDDAAGHREVRGILDANDCDPAVSDHVMTIISELSFMGGGTPRPMSSLEGEIVQDADRLDAIGAIGIARTFAYGGSRGRLIYDPGYTPNLQMTAEEYRLSKGDSISHFHEKLLLLKDLMNTRTAKRIAEERRQVMETFLDDFMHEWEMSHRYVNEQLVWE